MLQALKNPSNTAQSCENIKNYMEERCKTWNLEQGDLVGYDCPVCRNKGKIAIFENGYEFYMDCKCMEIRRSLWRAEKSGLKHLLQSCTFERYIATEKWQKQVLETAKEYTRNHENQWFYMGGQVGSGKTHICSAIVGEFLKLGLEARYMLWRDQVVSLKAMVMDDEAYAKSISPLKTCKVLYIDDFFKTEQKERPTTADINVAFEILNYRYNNPEMITVISSEYSIKELLDMDEAVGSRIYQKTKKYCIFISRHAEKNYRMK